MKRETIYFLFIVVIIVGLSYFGIQQQKDRQASTRVATGHCPSLDVITLKVDDTTTLVTGLAQTQQERIRGLANCTIIPSHGGMYFDLGEASQQSFWMKDMIVPIDIIWLREGEVIGIDRKVKPHPDPNASNRELKRYPSPGPADAVLEVASGQANNLKIKVGSKVVREG